VNQPAERRPLIAHVVHRFGIGGLENGVVNLINGLPTEAYRHAVVAFTEVTSLRERIRRDDVEYVSLHKPPGQGFRLFPALYRTFRRLAPAIVHTRNLGALEASFPAWLAGVPARVHGEHGWDVGDLDGSNRTYRVVRRMYRPFVHEYIALSRHLERYLVDRVGLPAAHVTQLYNGVDTARFEPADARLPIPGSPFDPRDFVVGTVGRLQAVKDQVTLARAFVRASAMGGAARRLRLVVVGDGPLRAPIVQVLRDAELLDHAWLVGERDDIADILRGLDLFVLPSLAEGVSNTILEAMASGLPVVATRVGGNPELVAAGVTGALVPPAAPAALAEAIAALAADPSHARALGQAARREAVARFSLERMLHDYHAVYRRALARAAGEDSSEPLAALGPGARRL